MSAEPRLIRMPWDAPPQGPQWTVRELRTAQALKADGLWYRQVADRLAELGYPVRDETDVANKLRREAKRK
jgi:hypothetical protein